ncbi:ADP-ribose pyrophosphatase [Pontibacter ummariensis]|uniref:GDP-mannose pyrophosphatase n=1 Tax=Pontibacter ummariensis TaxID=1610492 RepID=A0A239JNU1_9BACT|nr:NUDIX hydrolase [Pontibacter ummariensis]PRY07365.1 ADP-ribose pyrophosphatase [Pontibacter ummariensis]SNT07686.1 ADP-ribose pyrophosphatase [Pontibacter ummariensis]
MKIKNREIAYDGYFKMYKLTLEQKGNTFTREQYDRGEAVAALVYDTQKKEYILTKQFRIGSESELIEIVAGIIDEGEDPQESLKREIEEEIGYEVDKLEYITTFYSSPGGSSEKVYLYYAEVSHKHAEGGGNSGENEHIEVLHYKPEELKELQTPDAKTIIAQQWVRLHKPQG